MLSENMIQGSKVIEKNNTNLSYRFQDIFIFIIAKTGAFYEYLEYQARKCCSYRSHLSPPEKFITKTGKTGLCRFSRKLCLW